ncbi:MAG: hypothetical protein JNK64_09470 [Myxococcales bacterium]|nr:hypothetical protein [Myxococcales bacterium]
MSAEVALTLGAAAASVGALHALAPDHWLPIAAVGRAQGWSTGRTARVALGCGLGHVTVSVLLGLIGLVTGRQAVTTLGGHTAAVSGVLLVGFGVAYALWGLRHARAHLHGHRHDHYDHVHAPARVGARALFAIYAADPCVAVIPILFAAAALSVPATVAIVATYELATIGTMVTLVAVARAGTARVQGPWVERWAASAAGVSIAVTGVAVAVLGW